MTSPQQMATVLRELDRLEKRVAKLETALGLRKTPAPISPQPVPLPIEALDEWIMSLRGDDKGRLRRSALRETLERSKDQKVVELRNTLAAAAPGDYMRAVYARLRDLGFPETRLANGRYIGGFPVDPDAARRARGKSVVPEAVRNKLAAFEQRGPGSHYEELARKTQEREERERQALAALAPAEREALERQERGMRVLFGDD